MKTLTHTETRADILGLIEAIALARLEGQCIRISYAVQRKHLGKILFGKKGVTVNCSTPRRLLVVSWCAGYNRTSYCEHVYDCERLIYAVAD